MTLNVIRRSSAFILWSTDSHDFEYGSGTSLGSHTLNPPAREAATPKATYPLSPGLHPQKSNQGKWNQAWSWLQRLQRHLQEVHSSQWREKCTLENKKAICHLNSCAENTFLSNKHVSQTCLNGNGLDFNGDAVLVAIWCFILLFAISDKWGKYPNHATSHRVCVIQVLGSGARMGGWGMQPWRTWTPRASLVAQWLGVCLPKQRTRVRALVWEDPTCRGATGPVSHNCWACASGACAPQRERPRQWEARAPRWDRKSVV